MPSAKCKELFPHEDIVNLNKFFGDPAGKNGQVDAKWYKDNIVKWTPPYPMFYSDGKRTPLKTLLLHKKVVPVFTAAFTEVKEHFTPAEIKENHLDICGGTFNYRPMRGGSRLSVHAWGIAIDINAAWNGFNKKPTMSLELVKCFTDAGFDWGGTWKKPDGMHFQLASI